MQINPINKYLNSREYKLMVKKDLFKDKDEGIKKVTSPPINPEITELVIFRIDSPKPSIGLNKF